MVWLISTCSIEDIDAQEFYISLFSQCNREGKNRQPNVEPMFRALLDIMRFDPPTEDVAAARRMAKGMVEKFLERFAEEEEFCRYFKAQWADKLGAPLEFPVKRLAVFWDLFCLLKASPQLTLVLLLCRHDLSDLPEAERVQHQLHLSC